MRFYSTNSPNSFVDFRQAVFQSLPADKGLYMPERIPALDQNFWIHIEDYSFGEIAFRISRNLLDDAIPEKELKALVEDAVNFPAPLVAVEDNISVLELFHGPSLAFKDFGARFMSRVMARLQPSSSQELNILVATSGDTGGAVALGFYDVPGIRVAILYPAGKVSPIQEQQLTTLGKNITAVEVRGSFDDCQRMVKQAFLDKDLTSRFRLSSANSINIARLIPQAFYYVNAYAQLRRSGNDKPLYFSVPSGNFGNLTAGILAWRMGLPVARFIAATNVNDEVPAYLQTGIFTPRPTVHTISNAMDVGNPSNFVRMLDLFEGDVEKMRAMISGYGFTDEQTREAIERLFSQAHYLACPHTAVAYLGLKKYLQEARPQAYAGVFLSTAHPCKFPDIYEGRLQSAMQLPEQVTALAGREKKAVPMENDFETFKAWMLERR